MHDYVNTLTLSDNEYPPSLRNISSPPRQLYWQGLPPKEWLNRPKIGIVGSRKMSAYGKDMTERLAGGAARAGAVVISGLAYGVDITAHQAALAARGTTVAVLPSGLDSVYPPAHHNYARQIIQSGTLITEYPAGSFSFPSNFIARNRIISGLCDVLLITEAALKSGSLHTARFALEQGKTVMAVPGNINSPASQGCNNLIKSGAVPVTDLEDVLFALKIKSTAVKRTRISFENRHEEVIFGLIKDGVCAQDQIASAAGLDAAALSNALIMLEIAGHIRPAGGGNWLAA